MPRSYPRVGSLRYVLKLDHRYFYNNPSPTTGRIDRFAYNLRGESAEFEPEDDFPLISAARELLEPQLDVWRLSAIVQQGPSGFGFEFIKGFVDESAEDAEKRRDNPPRWPPNAPTNLRMGFSEYPQSLPWLKVNDCVKDLTEHYYASSLSARAHLLHAYAMVTRVETHFGDRKKAARALRMSVKCLRQMCALATNRGIGAAARKYTDNEPRRELTEDEYTWVRSLMRVMLYRTALLAGGSLPESFLSVTDITPSIW